MRIDKGKLDESGSWIVVLCILLTTILVIRRELVEGSSATATTAMASAPTRQAVYLDGSGELPTEDVAFLAAAGM